MYLIKTIQSNLLILNVRSLNNAGIKLTRHQEQIVIRIDLGSKEKVHDNVKLNYSIG